MAAEGHLKTVIRHVECLLFDISSIVNDRNWPNFPVPPMYQVGVPLAIANGRLVVGTGPTGNSYMGVL
jgi:hypothetical protein